jgi:type IV pilus assembly protein PilV
MGISRREGYTLIEVLVALCIFSIAALGVAELQWQAFSTIHQAALHAEALALASDVAERLRGLPDAETLFIDTASTLPDDPGCAEQACSAAQLAAADLAAWLDARRARLPSARMRICADDAPWDEARGAFRWECRGAGPAWIKLGWRQNSAEDGDPQLVLLLPGSAQ